MITIFTTTYNRGYIIENLYYSLKSQTCKDFEWVVIDDGSIDNTEDLFHKWEIETSEFPIKYKKVINGGKHRAINLGVNMAATDAFFIVDSDDYLVENAIEQVQKWFQTICGNSQYAGVSGLKGYSKDSPIGGWGIFSGKYIDATNLERAKYGLLHDKAEIYKTSFLKKYPFPEFEGENFLTEGIVWNKIALEGYKIRWYKEIIYICDYLDDGLTRCGYKRSIQNPKGYMSYLKLMLQIYGEEYGSKLIFGFYFVLRSDNNSIFSCQKKMQITLQEANKFEKTYQQMLIEMRKYFENRNIKNIAIYGLGNVGNAFLAIANNLNLNIKYAIDLRQIKNLKIPVYLPDEKKPPVDAVVITLKNYNKQVENNLLTFFANHIVYWKDISIKYWID